MELTQGSGVWLGQHSHKHGLFKVTHTPFLHVRECAPHMRINCCNRAEFQKTVWGKKVKWKTQKSCKNLCVCLKGLFSSLFQCCQILIVAHFLKHLFAAQNSVTKHAHALDISTSPSHLPLHQWALVFFLCNVLISHQILLWCKLFLLSVL